MNSDNVHPQTLLTHILTNPDNHQTYITPSLGFQNSIKTPEIDLQTELNSVYSIIETVSQTVR